MIKCITAKNFLSYANVSLTLKNNCVLNVCGDNWSGKSAFLEIVPYTLFGITRGMLKKNTVRSGCIDMECNIRIIANEKEYSIVRGIRKNNGYVKVFSVRGKLLSEGQEAQTYIDALIGFTKTEYMLSSYYGTDDSDFLIDTDPATRLETLQELALVHVFNDFFIEAEKHKKELSASIESMTKQIEVDSTIIAEKKERWRTRKWYQDQLAELAESIIPVSNKRKGLITDLEKNATLQHEYDNLKNVIAEEENNFVLLRNKESKLLQAISVINKDIDKDRKELEAKNSELELYNSYEKMLHDRLQIIPIIAELNTNLSLKTLAEKKEINVCPICESAIDAQTQKRWEKDIVSITEKLTAYEKELKELEYSIKRYELLSKEISSCDNRLLYANNELRYKKNELQEIKNQIAKLYPELVKHRARFDTIKSITGSREKLQEKLIKIDDYIAKRKEREGRLKELIDQLTDWINKCDILISEMKPKRHKLNELKFDFAAIGVVCRAFSRYGISNDLTLQVKKLIGELATEFLQYFMSGVVKIVDVEHRGKPGVIYCLSDMTGDREYAELCRGEKKILSLCVRLACGCIHRESKVPALSVLVLDEVVANLSEETRDNFIRFLQGQLVKQYKQIFVVSHENLKDVFTGTLKVTKKNGKSEIRAL